ncbi:hypothetical protein HIM_11273 [Hirsutella minnesotensis 3608]|uniref:Uncharacterized protein n=1 Tax=Hirsutella minnesotensis 3608 TaxID=1043627 RepID=A0A0F7ZRB7_9HYPO|nr:hypothetical protein HIM_11273 [Hirsutella minnesotensis 3608]
MLARILDVLGKMGGEIGELKNRVSEQSDTIRKLSATVYKQSTIIQGQEDNHDRGDAGRANACSRGPGAAEIVETNRWNLNMEASLAFQVRQRSMMRIFISEHKWKDGMPTEEEAIMIMNHGDDSAIPVPAIFMLVALELRGTRTVNVGGQMVPSQCDPYSLYVQLSRCPTLDGIVLISKARARDLVGNRVPEEMSAAQARLEDLSDRTVREALSWLGDEH